MKNYENLIAMVNHVPTYSQIKADRLLLEFGRVAKEFSSTAALSARV